MRKLSNWKSDGAGGPDCGATRYGGCGKTVGETIDDTTITTRVKTAMLNDPAVAACASTSTRSRAW